MLAIQELVPQNNGDYQWISLESIICIIVVRIHMAMKNILQTTVVDERPKLDKVRIAGVEHGEWGLEICMRTQEE